MAVQPLESRGQNPPIELRGQTVKLGCRQERARCNHVAELVLQAKQQLVVDQRIFRGTYGGDRLKAQSEAIFIQRPIYPRHPAHVTVALCKLAVVVAEHEDAVTTFVLGRMAGRVGRTQEVRDAVSGVGQRHETDACADGIALASPVEAKLTEQLQQCLGNMLCMLERAVAHDDAEFVPADARERVTMPDPLAQKTGELHEQLVTC